MQCEGWRRYGGAFTLGPVTWRQCTNEAIVTLTVTQDGKTEQLPACLECWNEAVENNITISAAIPVDQAIDSVNLNITES